MVKFWLLVNATCFVPLILKFLCKPWLTILTPSHYACSMAVSSLNIIIFNFCPWFHINIAGAITINLSVWMQVVVTRYTDDFVAEQCILMILYK